jgi:hypothetical protein
MIGMTIMINTLRPVYPAPPFSLQIIFRIQLR